MRHISIAAALFALTACNGGGSVSDAPRAEAEAAVDDLYKAFASGDSLKMMEHYAPGAVMIDAAHLKPTVDRQLQTQWTAQFATMHPSDFRTTDVTITPMGPDSFVATGLSSFTADVGQGRDVLHARFMQAFRKTDGRWRVVAEHISMPPPGPVQ